MADENHQPNGDMKIDDSEDIEISVVSPLRNENGNMEDFKEESSSSAEHPPTADTAETLLQSLQSGSSPPMTRSAPPISVFIDPRLHIPSGDALTLAMSQWQWTLVDGCRLPAVIRSGELFLAVHMVQLKLLSKFPPTIPPEMFAKYTMVSHKMQAVEAWTFNAVNAVLSKFELGAQLFSVSDEVVRLSDVLIFYWNVKALNLSRIVKLYSEELTNAGQNISFIATLTQLKKTVELDLEVVRDELKRLCPDAHNDPSECLTNGVKIEPEISVC